MFLPSEITQSPGEKFGARGILFLVAAAIPLAIAPGLLFHYDTTSKTIVLQLAAVIALLTFPATGSLRSRPNGRLLLWIAVFALAWFGAATALSTRPWFSLFGSAWRQFGLATIAPLAAILVWLAATMSAKPETVRVFLRITVCAGLAASFYAIAQYFDIDPFQSAAAYHAHAGDSVIVRPPATMGHADYFAWWLAVEFFCAIALARIETSRWRAIAWTGAAMAGLAILSTGTRAALVALAAGLVGLALISRIAIRKKHVAALCALLIGLGVLFLSPAGTRLRARVAWSAEEPVGGGRPVLWRDSLRMGLARPFAGYGPETFPAAFGAFESERLAHLYPDFHYESPHNVPLDLLTSQGVPGVLLLLAFAIAALRVCRGAIRHSPVLAAPLVAALIASGAAAMFTALILAPLLLSLAVAAILVSLDIPGQAASPSRAGRVLFALCAAGAGLLLVCGAEEALSDFRLARFAAHPNATAYEAYKKRTLPGAAEDIYASRVLLETCGKMPAIPARIQCAQSALRAAAQALKTADDPANAWYNLAIFAAANNDVQGTRNALENSARLAPRWFKPHWMLAKLFARTGERAQAVREAALARALNNNHNREVSETLDELTHN